MAKKKSSRTRTVRDRPIFVELKGDEVTTAIAEEDPNLFVGTVRPHPIREAGRSVKRVDSDRWKRYQASQIRLQRRQRNRAGQGMLPCSASNQMSKLIDMIKADYCVDPTYAAYRRTPKKTLFWKRLEDVEQDMGLNPPPHPTPGFPGEDY